jgi:hypothetical protein
MLYAQAKLELARVSEIIKNWTVAMRMKIVALSGLLGLCALSFAAYADDEADLALAGEAVGEMVTVEAMLSAAIDGECRQYVPEKLRISRETLRLEIADLQEMLPQSSRKRLTEQLNRQEFKAQMEAYKKKGVDDQLARLRSDGANPIFACGYVFGLLTDPVIHSEHRRSRALEQLRKQDSSQPK